MTTRVWLSALAATWILGNPLPGITQTMPSPGSNAPSFQDIQKNVYRPEIQQALQLGIVEGFPDGTFRPNQPVTREQAVSMIVDAINTMTPVDLNAPPTQTVRPFTDVPSDRWSYPKITWAQWNILPAGTPTGTFRPTDYITRADLVAFLRRAAETIKTQMGKSPALTPMNPPLKFTDVSGYNLQLTQQMSAYCQVASPVNEKGTKFDPTGNASRAYTTAAIIRTLACVKSDPR